MNDAAYVDYGPPIIPVTSSPLWVAARPGQEQYWAWNDPRWGAWGWKPEDVRYPISDIWEKLLRSAGFQGDIYRSVDVEIGIDPNGVPFYGSVIKATDEGKRAIDALRARGFDVRTKHPDRRTYNTYYGLFGPDGFIQDIKIEGDDGSANLLKAVLFTMPGWIGPLAGALSIPAPVLGTGIKLAAGADPLRTIVGAALPVVADTIMPSASVLPDTNIGEILPATEWLDTGAALPTIDTGFMGPVLPTIDAGADIVAELLAAPELLPLDVPMIEGPQFLIEPRSLDVEPVIDPVETWAPPIETVDLVEAPAAPVFEPEPLREVKIWTQKFLVDDVNQSVYDVDSAGRVNYWGTVERWESTYSIAPPSPPPPVFEPEPLPVFESAPVVELPTVAFEPPPVIEPPRVAPIRRPLGKFADLQESPVVEPPSWVEPPPSPIETFESIPMPVDVSTEAPPAFEPEPVQFEPVPVVELPAIETMAPIPTIDAAPPSIEPVEVFLQPVEVPAVYENEFLFNLDESSLFPEFEGPLLFDPYAGAEIPPAFLDDPFESPVGGDYWGQPEYFPPAYDVVTVDEAVQLPGMEIETPTIPDRGTSYQPRETPAGTASASVNDVIKGANDVMLQALKLVDSYRKLTNPPTVNQRVQSTDRASGTTSKVLPDGTVEMVDRYGNVVKAPIPPRKPTMAIDGSMVINNGDGTYTSISPSGSMMTYRYQSTGGPSNAPGASAAAPGGYSTALLIGGAAVLAFAVLS